MFNARGEIGLIASRFRGGGEEGNVAPRVTPNECKEGVNGSEKRVACTAAER